MKNIILDHVDSAISAELLIIPFYSGEPLPDSIEKINQALQRGIEFNMQRTGFAADLNSTMTMTTNGGHRIPELLFIGMGKRSDRTSVGLQQIGGTIAKLLEERNLELVALDASSLDSGHDIGQIVLGMRLKAWKFDKYQKQSETRQAVLKILSRDPEACEKAIQTLKSIYEGIQLARELTSEPANVMFPQAYVERCLNLQNMGIQITVLDEKKLQAIGAEALYSVGRGSINPPRLVTLHWKGRPDDEQTQIALVGKGVCFDSGGINIKTTHLTEMKWDKAGAGAVVGTIYALAAMRAPVNVVGVIGLVENMPDGAALKPGDIINTLSGQTVEVVDTDNEGRLVLADCLWYAQEQFSPQFVVDLGTLTLETFGVLAGEYAGLFCENPELTSTLIASGNASGEKLWQLPMGEPFAKQIHSSVADMKNIGILGFGESSAAAEFLKRFVMPNTRWAHLDIAGVAWTQEELPLYSPGVTGFGVRLLVEWITSYRL